MGMYLNPGNIGFELMRRTEYIDKTGLISQMNRMIDTNYKLICVSRPRRFGKSYAAKMLCAYYDRSCDSEALFADLQIAADATWRQYLNHYDVIYLDMTNILGKIESDGIISFIQNRITEELLKQYPAMDRGSSFDETLLHAVSVSGVRLIMIIDEWDAPIREMPAIQSDYLKFLRMLFKSSGTTDKIFAGVYMTGILPIKKDGSQSAISDFEEYTMVSPAPFAQYVGFTAEEVMAICREHDADFQTMKQWYDGYSLDQIGSVYNPNSVMKAIRYQKYRSYWTQTSASDNLLEFISLDFDGLARTAAELLAGIDITVDTNGFSNDLVTFRDRDDVLTLLIHLGYLAYNEGTGAVHIPNEEIRLEFAKAIRSMKHQETVLRVRESDLLIQNTIEGNAKAVAAQIEKIHREETTPLFYNNEQALRSVIKLAYFSYRDYYMRFEELPAGEGFADMLYLPRKDAPIPALLIELKWNTAAGGAISQIRKRHYPEALEGFEGEVLLVGISYDEKKKNHSCLIERMVRM